jgi:hypothetical protein
MPSPSEFVIIPFQCLSLTVEQRDEYAAYPEALKEVIRRVNAEQVQVEAWDDQRGNDDGN